MSQRATDVLRTEHDAILKMLDATTRACEQIERGKPVRPQLLDGLLEFFRLFADQCHHGKEEDLFFPLLEKRGIPRDGGPIGVMLYEHEQGRGLIAEMKASGEAYGAGDASAARRWAAAARQYAELLRQHIDKENNVLFVMAERVLSAAEQQEIGAAFDRLEVERMGAGTHERLHGRMAELLAELGTAAQQKS